MCACVCLLIHRFNNCMLINDLYCFFFFVLLLTVLFEQFHGFDSSLPTIPYSTFVSQKHQNRVTLLPRSTVPFRLLHLTMEGDEGVKKTLPFKIDNIAICEGGVSSTEIPWEDESP